MEDFVGLHGRMADLSLAVEEMGNFLLGNNGTPIDNEKFLDEANTLILHINAGACSKDSPVFKAQFIVDKDDPDYFEDLYMVINSYDSHEDLVFHKLQEISDAIQKSLLFQEYLDHLEDNYSPPDGDGDLVG